jgi:hypothetical protein
MKDIILDSSILPEPLLKLVDTDKVRVHKADGVITMLPVEEKTNYIDKLYGSLAGGDLTVDKFLEWTREDKELEA